MCLGSLLLWIFLGVEGAGMMQSELDQYDNAGNEGLHGGMLAENYSFFDEYQLCRFNPFDQEHCFSCWALAVTSVFSHRLCRKLGRQVILNPYHVTHCLPERLGCNVGGHEYLGWRFAQHKGFVEVSCNASQSCSYEHCHRYFIKHGSARTFIGEEEIKKEIMKNGPVTALISLMDDFIDYKGGVYEARSGGVGMYHTVEIVGWGIENDIKYWLVQNSYGSDWGENGFVRIIRGRNHIGTESYSTAGVPLV